MLLFIVVFFVVVAYETLSARFISTWNANAVGRDEIWDGMGVGFIELKPEGSDIRCSSPLAGSRREHSRSLPGQHGQEHPVRRLRSIAFRSVPPRPALYLTPAGHSFETRVASRSFLVSHLVGCVFLDTRCSCIAGTWH